VEQCNLTEAVFWMECCFEVTIDFNTSCSLRNDEKVGGMSVLLNDDFTGSVLHEHHLIDYRLSLVLIEAVKEVMVL
jgi:hypothetical protein